MRVPWNNPFHRTILIILLSPIIVVWFLDEDIVRFYGPAVLTMSVVLYLLDLRRHQESHSSGDKGPSPHLKLHIDGSLVSSLVVFGLVGAVGFFGFVGATDEGWISGMLIFAILWAIGLVGVGWMLNRRLSVQ
jgi:hypothetical protein